jgi:biopolymer transport protein ExbB
MTNAQRRGLVFVVVAVGFAALVWPVAAAAGPVLPQPPTESTDTATAPPSSPDNSAASGTGVSQRESLDFLDLLTRGGPLMWPLAALSILVVALVIERAIVLRRGRLLPPRLVADLTQLARQPSGLDPRLAFRACTLHPSVAARVIKAMLSKAGRPHTEIEAAATQAAQRETTRLHNVVSWLTMAATVAPLIGLLGTVQGMIEAFFETSQLVPGQNKTHVLAHGIYVALVTTMAGLGIAIPAAIFAHFYETRILNIFTRIDELVSQLAPKLEHPETPVRGRTGDAGATLVDVVDAGGRGAATRTADGGKPTPHTIPR